MTAFTPIRLSREARELDLDSISKALRPFDVRFDTDREPHVALRPSVPWVPDRGWLNFIGNWHYFAGPPGDNAAWARSIAPTSAGQAEVWLAGLTPGTTYLVAIDAGCSEGGPNAGFRIGASDAAGGIINAQPPDQVLLVLITPHMNMSLVRVNPQDLETWIFNSATVYEIS